VMKEQLKYGYVTSGGGQILPRHASFMPASQPVTDSDVSSSTVSTTVSSTTVSSNTVSNTTVPSTMVTAPGQKDQLDSSLDSFQMDYTLENASTPSLPSEGAGQEQEVMGEEMEQDNDLAIEEKEDKSADQNWSPWDRLRKTKLPEVLEVPKEPELPKLSEGDQKRKQQIEDAFATSDDEEVPNQLQAEEAVIQLATSDQSDRSDQSDQSVIQLPTSQPVIQSAASIQPIPKLQLKLSRRKWRRNEKAKLRPATELSITGATCSPPSVTRRQDEDRHFEVRESDSGSDSGREPSPMITGHSSEEEVYKKEVYRETLGASVTDSHQEWIRKVIVVTAGMIRSLEANTEGCPHSRCLISTIRGIRRLALADETRGSKHWSQRLIEVMAIYTKLLQAKDRELPNKKALVKKMQELEGRLRLVKEAQKENREAVAALAQPELQLQRQPRHERIQPPWEETLQTETGTWTVLDFDKAHPIRIRRTTSTACPFEIVPEQLAEAVETVKEVKAIQRFITQTCFANVEDLLIALQAPDLDAATEITLKRALIQPFTEEAFVLHGILGDYRAAALQQLEHGGDKHLTRTAVLASLPALTSTAYLFESMTFFQPPASHQARRQGRQDDHTESRRTKILGLRSHMTRYFDVFSLLGKSTAKVLSIIKSQNNDTTNLGQVLHWLPHLADFPRSGARCYLSKALASTFALISMLSWKIYEARHHPEAMLSPGSRVSIVIEDADVKHLVSRLQLEATPGLGMSSATRQLYHDPGTLAFYAREGTAIDRQQAWNRAGGPPLQDRSAFLTTEQIRELNEIPTSRRALAKANIRLLPCHPIDTVLGKAVNKDPACNGIKHQF
jgi:hypothetical protein